MEAAATSSKPVTIYQSTWHQSQDSIIIIIIAWKVRLKKQFPQSDEHMRHAKCDLATLSIT